MKRYSFLFIVLSFVSISWLSSCLKQDYDGPPDTSGYDPQLPVNMTIGSLKSKMVGFSVPQRIDSDWTIYGIVTADDRSGNFYKQINIEDSTGGITILVDGNSLYARYPVGRKVYIRLQGLYFGYDAKMPQIGRVPDNTGGLSDITSAVADSFIVRASFPHEVPVHDFDGLAELKTISNPVASNMIGRLVRIDNVEVAGADTGKTYAQPASISSGTSINIQDCSGNKIILRTSGYANFQALPLPKGKGSITALYTVFNSTPQLIIRDTSDLQLNGERCSSANSLITIDSLRNMFPGSGTLGLTSGTITGVVISDADSGNAAPGNFIIEDNSHKGIILYIGSGNYKLGDSLVIELSGGNLQLYAGALELKDVPASNIFVKATGKTVVPTLVTLANLVANFTAYESTLVKIEDVSISSGTYSGNKNLDDGSGPPMVLYTSSSASFATRQVWIGFKTITAIVTPFNSTKELKFRNPTIDILN